MADEDTLGWYVSALFSALDEGDPAGAERVRRIAGGRSARIGLDDEVVLVRFDAGRLLVAPDRPAAPVDGTGTTDRTTVIDLLGARLEAYDAITTGRVEVVGAVDAVAAMLTIIEILLDSSSRVPALQELAGRLRTGEPPAARRVRGPVVPWAGYPDALPSTEISLLADLDLLRDRPAEGSAKG